MMSKPAQLNETYPGSKSRYDDFQALHIDATPFVHWNVKHPDPAQSSSDLLITYSGSVFCVSVKVKPLTC